MVILVSFGSRFGGDMGMTSGGGNIISLWLIVTYFYARLTVKRLPLVFRVLTFSFKLFEF